MGKKKHPAEKVDNLVCFGGPDPGTNPHYPCKHGHVDEWLEPYFTDDGGINQEYFNQQNAQTQFNAYRGNKYIGGAIYANAPNQNAVNEWLAWADANGGYNDSLPATPKCPSGTAPVVYVPVP
jgi:hypothetical protein